VHLESYSDVAKAEPGALREICERPVNVNDGSSPSDYKFRSTKLALLALVKHKTNEGRSMASREDATEGTPTDAGSNLASAEISGGYAARKC
jgi:hypothetical protein